MKKILSVLILSMFIFAGLLSVVSAGGPWITANRCPANQQVGASDSRRSSTKFYCGKSYAHVQTANDGAGYVQCKCVKAAGLPGSTDGSSSATITASLLCGDIARSNAGDVNTYLESKTYSERIKNMKKSGDSTGLVVVNGSCQNSCYSGMMWGYRNVKGQKVLTAWNAKRCR